MYHSLIRILAAARLLGRSRGATVAEIAENLGVDRRSAYRTLDALEELNYPLVKDEEHGGRYRLMDGACASKWWMPVPVVAFDLEDRILLDWLFDSVARSGPLADRARSLRRKLSFVGAATGIALEPKDSGAGSATRPCVLVERPVLAKALSEESEKVLSTLLSATAKRLACEVSYEARESGEVRTYDIHPLAVFESDGGLYAFVLVPYYGSIRVLALERIRELVSKDESFVLPDGFDAEARLADPFGFIQGEQVRVLLRFSAGQALYVRDRAWPDSYRLEDDGEGRLLMSFETGGIFGLKRWVLSWGDDAEILEPDWLREEMRTVAAAMVKAYS